MRRLELLFEAIALLQQQNHRVAVLLLGDGPERQSLSDLAAKLGIKVHFAGACYDQAKVVAMTSASAVTAAPGKVGLTAIQSLSCGVSAITHDDPLDQMPEWEAIRSGLTGDFFERDSVTDLAAKLRDWTEHPEVAPQTRDACFSLIDRFWNPAFQARAIERALDGKPADGLFWMREENKLP